MPDTGLKAGEYALLQQLVRATEQQARLLERIAAVLERPYLPPQPAPSSPDHVCMAHEGYCEQCGRYMP